jgi:hypothetical protein
MSSLRKLADVEGVLALSCSADGELVAVNDDRGCVRFLATSPNPEWLLFELSRGDTRAVLLHPDGSRVCVLVGDDHPVVRILDPRTAVLLQTLVPGLSFAPEPEREVDADDPKEKADLYVSILEHRPPLLSRLPLEIVNVGGQRICWWPNRPDTERIDALLWPERVSRLALHPNHRWLAVLDRGCFVIDLESGDLISTIDRELELASLLEDGEGAHTLAIDDRGSLLVARTGISGNPFLAVDRFDIATGEQRSTTETWQQIWFDTFEVDIYDPTSILQPARIPAGEYAIVYRRISLELWSCDGLLRTYPLQPSTCVIPSFDPGNFCASARALLIDDDELTLLDLISGERTRCQPRARSGELLRPAELRWVEFVPGRSELLLHTDSELLISARGGDQWSRCPLPDGRRPKRWVHAGGSSERLRVILLDDADGLWMAELDLAPTLAASPQRSLVQLEAEAFAHPDASEPFAVLADALSERGDPRGELILLQLMGAETAALALVQRNACVQLAGLRTLAPTSYELEWRFGFVRSALFRVENREQLAEVLCFLGTDFARLLESLEIRFSDSMDATFRLELQVHLLGYFHAAARWPLLRSPPRLT